MSASLPSQYQEYIHLSRYARYREDLGRRETWEETVTRYCDFFQDKFPKLFPYKEIHSAILNLEVMPSMRAMMSAGPALERDNMAGYNCSYLPIDHPRAFDEAMYILLCGTGVGFSVERQYVNKLPDVPELNSTSTTIIVEDSKIGWANAYRQLLSLLWGGAIPKYDTSRVRPAGSILKVFGGRASGPEPLEDLFRFTIGSFEKAQGRKLNSLEIHDIVCKIADVVVVGGVRRSALLSLSNLTDERMRNAKQGQWWELDGQRRLANNSVSYTEKPDVGIFMEEWNALYQSKSGERGIFNRVAAQLKAKSTERRESDHEFGTNPCGEIILRPHGLCNLSEVVVRSNDSREDLVRKVGLASVIGTFQSTLTNFRYVRKIWQKNAEEERLLGVSLTGIMDHGVLSGRELNGVEYYDDISPREFTLTNTCDDWLRKLKDEAIKTNKDYASRLGISPSVSITTVKPSGTVSQLVDSSSGIHPRHSRYYLRSVRADKKDPLSKFMREKGFYVEDDVTKPDTTDIFCFPIASPAESVSRKQMTALQQLEHYLVFKNHWCEHNPSITIYVKEDEWIDVEAWVYRHFHDLGGVSFLPYDGGSYRQAPYQELTEEEYHAWVEKTKHTSNIDWTELREEQDQTSGMQELACMAGACEIN